MSSNFTEIADFFNEQQKDINLCGFWVAARSVTTAARRVVAVGRWHKKGRREACQKRMKKLSISESC